MCILMYFHISVSAALLNTSSCGGPHPLAGTPQYRVTDWKYTWGKPFHIIFVEYFV